MSLTNLTTLAALDPVLLALPAWANYEVDLADDLPSSPTAWLNIVRSRICDSVDMRSNQKKKELKYPSLTMQVIMISVENMI